MISQTHAQSSQGNSYQTSLPNKLSILNKLMGVGTNLVIRPLPQESYVVC